MSGKIPKTTRRSFLELSAKAAAAGCILRGHSGPAQQRAGKRDGMVYGVQMFMVRHQAETDLAGAFRAIHDAGFDQVELYPIAYKHPPATLRRILADAGLASVSGHFDYTGPLSGSDMSVEYAQGLGLQYLVCPMLPEDQKLSLDGFRKAAAYFNQWGEDCRKAGIQFVFHNHCYEFKPIDGSNGWTVLMKETDPKLVKLELDLFWLVTGGQNPAEMLKMHADRAVLVHLKDRVADAPTSFIVNDAATSYCTELGKGTIPWPALLEQARRQGIHYAYLDQDETRIPVEQSMKESRAYLRSLAT